MNQEEAQRQMIWQIEEFGRESIKLFHDEGVKLGLFRPEDHDIVFESLRQQAEGKIVKELQEHFDEHHKEGSVCEDQDTIGQVYDLEVATDGKVTVKGKKSKGGTLN